MIAIALERQHAFKEHQVRQRFQVVPSVIVLNRLARTLTTAAIQHQLKTCQHLQTWDAQSVQMMGESASVAAVRRSRAILVTIKEQGQPSKELLVRLDPLHPRSQTQQPMTSAHKASSAFPVRQKGQRRFFYRALVTTLQHDPILVPLRILRDTARAICQISP